MVEIEYKEASKLCTLAKAFNQVEPRFLPVHNLVSLQGG